MAQPFLVHREVDLTAIDVQLVLYHTDLSNVERSLHAMAGAVDYQDDRPEGPLELTVRLGDCSAVQTLGADVLGGWKSYFGGRLVIEYEYFAGNLGHGGAQNRLAENGSGEYILFSNPDVVPLPSAISLLQEFLRDDPRIGIVDAKQLPLEHPKYFEPTTGLASWCSGAFSMVRRSDFQRVGGFDHETFFMYCDDVDLSWRLRLDGLAAAHQPAAVVYHSKKLDHSGSIETTASERYYSAEAALLLAWKWGARDVLEGLIAYMTDSDNADQRAALARFRELKAAGALPVVVEDGAVVADFIGGGYGRSRW